jgi:hypothetical protein
MAHKKTIKELEAAAKAAEARAKKLREQAAAITKAEEAKTNAEIIKALREWYSTWSKRDEIAWGSLPEHFRSWADKQRRQAQGKEQGDAQGAL